MKKIMVTGGAGRFAQHIKNLTKDDKNLISYIKSANGYVEVPISLIDKDNSTSYYLLSTISQ